MIERFLSPLTQSPHKKDFILKGATSLDGARVMMQIDVGFGDAVEPAPKDIRSPPCYRWTRRNSRMKDFFDIWTLANTQRFEATRLSRSIRVTFEQRHTHPHRNAARTYRRIPPRPRKEHPMDRLLQKTQPARHAIPKQPAKLIWNPPGPWL